MPFQFKLILWAVILFVVLLVFVASTRYFWATDDTHYKSFVRRCRHCTKYKRESYFEGYCHIWKRNMLKNSVCKFYTPNSTWVQLLEKFGF